MSAKKSESIHRNHVAIRIDQAVVARIDAHAARMHTPGVKPTRSNAVRALIELGLQAVDENGLDAVLESISGERTVNDEP